MMCIVIFERESERNLYIEILRLTVIHPDLNLYAKKVAGLRRSMRRVVSTQVASPQSPAAFQACFPLARRMLSS